ncbi:hypothetical protein DDK19_10650 [Pseudomonas aeruginosa]|nr:hypothetical protein DDK19_10650 [Pseudomonas aeruginosa]
MNSTKRIKDYTNVTCSSPCHHVCKNVSVFREKSRAQCDVSSPSTMDSEISSLLAHSECALKKRLVGTKVTRE